MASNNFQLYATKIETEQFFPRNVLPLSPNFEFDYKELEPKIFQLLPQKPTSIELLYSKTFRDFDSSEDDFMLYFELTWAFFQDSQTLGFKSQLLTEVEVTLDESYSTDEILDRAVFISHSLLSKLSYGDRSERSFILKNESDIIVYRSDKTVIGSENNRQCSLCHSYLDAQEEQDNQIWDNDPIRTPKASAGEKYLGFQRIKRKDILEIQNNKSEISNIEWTLNDNEGLFRIKRNHIEDIREVIEEQLDEENISKESFFNFDINETDKKTFQTDWHNPSSDVQNLANKRIRAFHVEDLRHQVRSIDEAVVNGENYLMSLFGGTLDKFNEVNKYVASEFETSFGYIDLCMNKKYVFGIKYDQLFKMTRLEKRDRASMSLLSSTIVGGSYKLFGATQVYGISCDKDNVYVIGKIGTQITLAIYRIKATLSFTALSLVDNFTLCSTQNTTILPGEGSLGYIDAWRSLGIEVGENYIYCAFVLRNVSGFDSSKGKTPECYPYASQWVYDGGGVIKLIKINREDGSFTEKDTFIPKTMLGLKANLIGEPTQQAYKCHWQYWGGERTEVFGVYGGMGIDKDENLYFSLWQRKETRTILSWVTFENSTRRNPVIQIDKEYRSGIVKLTPEGSLSTVMPAMNFRWTGPTPKLTIRHSDNTMHIYPIPDYGGSFAKIYYPNDAWDPSSFSWMYYCPAETTWRYRIYSMNNLSDRVGSSLHMCTFFKIRDKDGLATELDTVKAVNDDSFRDEGRYYGGDITALTTWSDTSKFWIT